MQGAAEPADGESGQQGAERYQRVLELVSQLVKGEIEQPRFDKQTRRAISRDVRAARKDADKLMAQLDGIAQRGHRPPVQSRLDAGLLLRQGGPARWRENPGQSIHAGAGHEATAIPRV